MSRPKLFTCTPGVIIAKKPKDKWQLRRILKTKNKWYLRQMLFATAMCLLCIAVKAQPIIGSLSASSGIPGSSITISGSGFNTTGANNAVYFGATRAAVTSASASSLTVTVPYGATYMPVSVTNTTTALTGYSSKYFLPTYDGSSYISGGFNVQSKIKVGSVFAAGGTTLCDIDGDGKEDILVAGNSDNIVSIFRNAGTTGSITETSFPTAVNFPAGSANGVMTADMDGDGKPDVIVTNGGVSIFRNIATSGSITISSLAAKVNFTIPGNISIADIDGDGRPDIVASNYDANTVSVYRNTSSVGSLSFAAAVDFATGNNPNVIQTADIDGDGKPEIIVGNDGDNNFSILHNIATAGTISSGSFDTHFDLDPNGTVSGIKISDIDGDGKQDLVVHQGFGENIYRNTATTGVINGSSLASPVLFLDLYIFNIGDIDGDGKPDLVTPTDDAQGIAFYRNISTSGTISAGSFASAVNLTDIGGNPTLGGPSVSNLYSINIGDLDGDGKPDLTAMSSALEINVFKNFPLRQPPTITSLSTYSGIPGASVTITGTNFNTTAGNNKVYFGATKATVSSASSTSLTVAVPAGATYGPVTVTNAGSSLTASSGKNFLPAYNHSAYTPGAINFDAQVDFLSGTTTSLTALADFDGDGKPDMAVCTTNGVSVYRNTSTSGSITSGSFGTKVDFAITGLPNSMNIADMNGDGKPDIVVGLNSSPGGGYILLNTASSGTITSGSFTGIPVNVQPMPGSVGYISPYDLSVGDIDGDGRPDLVSANDNHVSVFQNRAEAGTFNIHAFETTADQSEYSFANVYARTSTADLNGDNKPDLLVNNGFNFYGELLVLPNTARMGIIANLNSLYGTASSMGDAQEYDGPGAIYMANAIVTDIDGDGKPDVVVPSYPNATDYFTNGYFSVFRNTGSGATIDFADPVNITASSAPRSVAVGDIDGDGKPDVVVADGDNSISIYRNVATSGSITTSSFAAPVHIHMSTYPYFLAIGDLDGDGKPEIIITNDGGTVVTVLHNNPSAIGGTITTCIGGTNTLTDGIASGTWSSSNTAVATIGSASGVFTGIAAGTATITYTFPSSGNTTVVVSVYPVPAAITGTTSVCGGATTTLSDAVSGGIWSSGNLEVATINSSTGVVTGRFAGTAIITYNTGCGTGVTATVTVTDTTVGNIFGSGGPLCVGATVVLMNGVSGGVWSSSNTSVATIDAAGGLTTGIAAGTTTISYTLTNSCGTGRVTTVMTINPAPTPITGSLNLCISGTTTLSSTPTGGTWARSTSAVASVGSTSGIVTGIAAGTSRITYTKSGCRALTTVTVSSSASAGTITGAGALCTGATLTLGNTATGGTWSSASTGIATVGSTSGVVSGVSAGTTTISYQRNNGCGLATATANVTVSLTADAGTITGSSSVALDSTIALSDAASGGTWSASNSNVSITSGGVVTGNTLGTVTVSYSVNTSCGTAVATKLITVTLPPIGGTFSIPGGGSTTLSNPIAGGTWSGSCNTVATITSSGTVTGISSGTATITYTVSGSSVTTAITVSATSTAITGSMTICEGATTSLAHPISGGTWSSANTSVAGIGASNGVVTGITAGVVALTYSFDPGCSSNTVMTVNPLPVTGSITGTAIVCQGATTTLSDAAIGGVWSSSNASVATVGSTGVVSGVAAGATTISYSVTNGCGTLAATQDITVNPLPSAGTITGTATVCTGAATALTNATSGGVWSSNATEVATVGTDGTVTGITAGNTTISYTVTNGCGSVAATRNVTVNAAPNAGTISGASSVGLSATISLTDGVTGGTWTVGNANATITSGGVLTGVTAGTVMVSYSVTNSCGTAVATKLVSVGITLGPILGTLTACTGYTTALSNATTGGTWSSSNSSVAIIGISTGIATGIAAGTTTITYSLSGSTVTAILSVSSVPAVITGANTVCLNATTTLSNATTGGTWSGSNTSIAGIDVTTGVVTGNATGSVTISYTLGTGCYKTMAMTVKPLPAPIAGSLSTCIGGTTIVTDPTTVGVSWISGNISVATVGSTSGVVTGVAMGTSILTYTINTGCAITAVLSVNPLPAAITGASSVCAGSTATLGSTTTGGTWSSGTTGVATVGSGTGIVTGVAAGVANITYSAGAGCYITAPVTVNPLPAMITGATTLCNGTTTALSDATSGGAWSSVTTAVATVGTTGIVTGTGSGTSVISYTLGTGCARTTTVTVSGSLSAITGNPVTCIGLTTTLSDATTGGTWASSSISTATVNSAGVVSAIAAGTSNITYALSTGCRAMVTITVNASVPAITGATSVCVNATTTLSNTAGGGTWSSSNAALGTVNASTGAVTGIAAGTPTISYTLGSGCYRTLNVTVKAPPGAIAGNAALCTGATSTLSDGTGTSWTSSNTSVATVGITSGVVTGVGAGTATITFTGTTGCIATKVTTVDVAPSVAAITGLSAVAVAHTITLADATGGGTWSSSAVTKATVDAGGVVTGVAVGASTISYNVTNGVCKLSVTKVITVSASRPGIAEASADEAAAFNLYPNPNTGSFTVHASAAGILTVYTLEGKEIKRYNVDNGNNALQLPNGLAAGVYMCRYNGDDGSTAMVRLVYGQ